MVEEVVTNYSNSYLQRYKSCPLAAYFHYDLKLRKQDEGAESHHMAYSRAFHDGLRLLYSGDTLVSAQQAFLDGYPIQLAEDDLAKTRDNGVKALSLYAHRWQQEDKRWKVLQVEQMDSQDDGFVVKLDLVLQDRETEQIYGLDHKVTGKYINYDWWATFEPNSQITEYVRFIKERWGFCDGFIVNTISLRWLNEKDKRGGFNGQWLDPASDDRHNYSHCELRDSRYHRRPMLACWGLRVGFERQTFNRNDRQLEQALTDRHYWEDRVEQSKASGLWGMNTSQCKFCEYQEICKAGWSYPDDEELINITYRRICGKWYNEPLQQCSLDRNHEGEHGQATAIECLISVED